MGSFAERLSFRQKPQGLFKALLRLPGYLFRWDLGFLLGNSYAGRVEIMADMPMVAFSEIDKRP